MTSARIARARSATVIGVDAHEVVIECVRTRGLPALRIVGLPDAAVREAGDRVRTAVQQCGLDWPRDRIVLNLAPADLPKGGSAFDLAIACAVLAASGQVPADALDGVVLVGELGLDASVQPAATALTVARGLARSTASTPTRLLVATQTAHQLGCIDRVDAVGVDHLREVVELLRGARVRRPVKRHPPRRRVGDDDLADVRGQPVARRAIEIAAAGGHHVLLSGPNGTGKSMLARRVRGLLPDLDDAAAVDVAAIRAAAGLANSTDTIDVTPPLREVHPPTTAAALVGGGSGIPQPGDMTLAHHGVLVLDELGEFRRAVLDTLRQPLETAQVHLGRGRHHVTYACRVLLAATTNRCPCGRRGDPARACRCRPDELERYRSRLSEPLRDRIDLHVDVQPVDLSAHTSDGEPTAVVAARVAVAREHAAQRWGRGRLVRDATRDELSRAVGQHARARAQHAAKALGLSARGLDRIVRVARTIADVEGESTVGPTHVDEAVHYRAFGAM